MKYERLAILRELMYFKPHRRIFRWNEGREQNGWFFVLEIKQKCAL